MQFRRRLPAEVAVGHALGVVQAAVVFDGLPRRPSPSAWGPWPPIHHAFQRAVMVVPFSADSARHRPAAPAHSRAERKRRRLGHRRRVVKRQQAVAPTCRIHDVIRRVVEHLERLVGERLGAAVVRCPRQAVIFGRCVEWQQTVSAAIIATGEQIGSVAADAHVPTVGQSVGKRLPRGPVVGAADGILVGAAA